MNKAFTQMATVTLHQQQRSAGQQKKEAPPHTLRSSCPHLLTHSRTRAGTEPVWVPW